MIETTRDAGALTVKVRGRIDGSNASEFQDKVKNIFTDEDKTVMMDMSELEYISSAGLRVVLMLAKLLEQRKLNFAIHSLSDPIREVFEISGFDKIIKVHDSREQALAAFN